MDGRQQSANPQTPVFLPLSQETAYYGYLPPLLNATVHEQYTREVHQAHQGIPFLCPSNYSAAGYYLQVPPVPMAIEPPPTEPPAEAEEGRELQASAPGRGSPWASGGDGLPQGAAGDGNDEGPPPASCGKGIKLTWKPKEPGHGEEPETSVFLSKHQILPVRRSDAKTTVMIKNIPPQMARSMLLEFLDKHCMAENQKARDGAASAYDFVYLPLDFSSCRNKGYAFVNFTNPTAVWKFYQACNGKRWKGVQSTRICEIGWALIQGKEAMLRHYRGKKFECDSEECLPMYFVPPRDGSGAARKEKTVGKHGAQGIICPPSGLTKSGYLAI